MPWLGTLRFFFPQRVCIITWCFPAIGEVLVPSMIFPIFDFFSPNLDELGHFILSVSTNNLPIAGRSSSHRRGFKCEQLHIWKTSLRHSSLPSLTWCHLWSSVNGSQEDFRDRLRPKSTKSSITVFAPTKDRTFSSVLFITFAIDEEFFFYVSYSCPLMLFFFFLGPTVSQAFSPWEICTGCGFPQTWVGQIPLTTQTLPQGCRVELVRERWLRRNVPNSPPPQNLMQWAKWEDTWNCVRLTDVKSRRSTGPEVHV